MRVPSRTDVGGLLVRILILLLLYGFACGIYMLYADGPAATAEPAAQLVVPCTITEWHDGDTPTVEITLRVRVRLIDCWAPEITGKSRAQGLASREHALQAFPVGSAAKLTIPLEGMDRIDDALSFGRVIGRVAVDGKDVASAQIEAGHATKNKNGN